MASRRDERFETIPDVDFRRAFAAVLERHACEFAALARYDLTGSLDDAGPSGGGSGASPMTANTPARDAVPTSG